MADVTGDGLGAPAVNGFSITPSDVTAFSVDPRALYIGGAGDVAVVMRGGPTLTFSGCAAGSILPIRVTKVLSTGTTATLIIGLF